MTREGWEAYDQLEKVQEQAMQLARKKNEVNMYCVYNYSIVHLYNFVKQRKIPKFTKQKIARFSLTSILLHKIVE